MRTGEIMKSVSSTPTEEELLLINKYTRRPFEAGEVYVFSVVLCDNDVDRDFERFTVESLFQLEKLFVGKTGICDHSPKAENQCARIYSCNVEAVEGRKTATGDDYFRLVAKAYMPRCESNENIITQVESGIRKEVSIGCASHKAVCSVCSSERGHTPCGHRAGEVYGGKLCYYELQDIADAYEWSFVAVPAQREAGVIKNYQSDNKEISDMNGIIKTLDSGESVTLCVEDAKRLYEYIENLTEKAYQGDIYRQELTSEVLRMSALCEPMISTSAMENALKGLSINELKEFAKSFGHRAQEKICAKPNTAPKKSTDTPEGNREFKI